MKTKGFVQAVLVYLAKFDSAGHIDEIALAVKSPNSPIGPGTRNGYGGGIEDGESELEAAVREVREEGEIIIDPHDLVKVAIVDFQTEKSDGTTFVCRVHIFLISTWQGELTDTVEMRDPRWYKVHFLPVSELMPADLEWLPSVLVGKKIMAKAYYGPGQLTILRPMEIEEVMGFERF